MTGSSSTVQHVSYEQRFGKGFEDTKRRIPDVQRARTVLDFNAGISLQDGLQRTLAWWRATHQ
jgi:UDP-glucose 4-epimerase